MRYLKPLILLIALFLLPNAISYSQQPREAGEYFSYEKYAHTYVYFRGIENLEYKRDGLAARTIKALADRLVWGFDALNERRLDEAIVWFRKGLKVLPEYMHLDFIIALSYEEKGDYRKASEFYLSYLDKLKRFHKGMFRITGALIEETVNFDILSYPEAEALIRERLAGYGIDLEEAARKKSPVLAFAAVISALAVGSGILFLLWGRIKKAAYNTRAALHKGGSSWICRYCGTENANINSACYKCGREPSL